MPRNKTIYRLIYGLLAGVLLTSCYTDYDIPVCDYKVQLNYHYNMENTSVRNMLESYVSAIDEYIFDEQGILYAINRVDKDLCDGHLVSEIDLPPGRYSVISWGNPGPSCAVNSAVVGVTRREDMMLLMDNPCSSQRAPAGYHTNTDRLYHGYRTFTVEPEGITRIRIDMTHSHFVLRFRVRWAQKAPANTGDFAARLREVTSEYDFMPEYISRNRFCREHDALADDDYRKVCNEVIHHIPWVHQHRNRRGHSIDVDLTVDSEIHGQFITFRNRNAHDVIMSLHSGDPATGNVVMKEVGLKKVFESYNVDLDRTLKQEYALDFLIDGDRVTVSAMDVADWDEGGVVGTTNK